MQFHSWFNKIWTEIKQQEQQSTFFITRWLFLRVLGAIYLVAFLSLSGQLEGLIGSDGILPIASLLTTIELEMGKALYWQIPTLCWFDPSDSFLHLQCNLGITASLLVIFNVFPIFSLCSCWIFYLSLSVAGQVFMGYQWDALLLETGLLAIFFAPLRIFPTRPLASDQPSPIVRWLLWWLLFRLIFSSGIVKILSGDLNWRNWTALEFHYYTQPLPNMIAWYAHQLPVWFHKMSVAIMFFIELLVPFFIFATRRIRFVGCFALICLQLLIAATGNYGFFNVLTIALCLLLLDDQLLQRFTPRFLQQKPSTAKEAGKWQLAMNHNHGAAAATLAILVALVSISNLYSLFTQSQMSIPVVKDIVNSVRPLRSINNYGLFAIMTTKRPEIIIEGSNDGKNWQQYHFYHKPGEEDIAPSFVAPHQPRLDWQMWFAALSEYKKQPWFARFLEQLLRGSPTVGRLLKENPFPKGPRYLRVLVYYYKFTPDEVTPYWWQRELAGQYCPVLTLQKK